jgi:branched-chain amino acid transport system substrate-binding protein
VRNKKLWFIIGAVVVIAAIIIGIRLTQEPTQQQRQVYKIGAILPLTGDAAQWGEHPRNAINLAVEQMNASLSEKEFEVVFEDAQANPRIGVAAFRKLITNEHVPVVIGEVASAVTLVVAPIAEQEKVVLISPASTNSKISEAGDFIFRTINADILEGSVMAEFLINEQNIKRVAVLTIQTAGTVGMCDSFVSRFKSLQGDVVLYEKVSEGTSDFRSSLSVIKQSTAQALYLVGYPKETGLMVKQARELGLSIPLFSAQPAEDPEVTKIAKGAVDKVTFTTTTLPPEVLGEAYIQFAKAYQARFGVKPGSFAAEAYDAANLIMKAILERGYDGPSIRDYLYSVKNYPGASGPITFDRNGDVHKPIIINEYDKNGNTRPVAIFKEGKIESYDRGLQ